MQRKVNKSKNSLYTINSKTHHIIDSDLVPEEMAVPSTSSFERFLVFALDPVPFFGYIFRYHLRSGTGNTSSFVKICTLMYLTGAERTTDLL